MDFHLIGSGRYVAAGLLTICAFLFYHLLSSVACLRSWYTFLAQVLMILFAVFHKYNRIIPASMETSAHSVYKFVSSSLVWTLIIVLGDAL
ncbi:MAG: 2-hydroxycarboxylate transporter family protein [Symbiopectobacterium sp.]